MANGLEAEFIKTIADVTKEVTPFEPDKYRDFRQASFKGSVFVAKKLQRKISCQQDYITVM